MADGTHNFSDATTPLQSYVLSRTVVTAEGCWRATTARNPVTGYATASANGKSAYMHRLAFAAFHGPIPEGAWIDHTCHNADPTCNEGIGCLHRICCNPAHLEAVSPRENLMRGRTSAARNAAKTHCPQGHEYTPANTYRQRDGARLCKACGRERGQRAKARKEAHEVTQARMSEAGMVRKHHPASDPQLPREPEGDRL